MFKLNFGDVTNPVSNVTEQVEFNVLKGIDVKGLLVGSGLMLLGLGIVVITQVKNAGETTLSAENSALFKAGLMDENVIAKAIWTK